MSLHQNIWLEELPEIDLGTGKERQTFIESEGQNFIISNRKTRFPSPPVLGIEPRALCMPGERSATESHAQQNQIILTVLKYTVGHCQGLGTDLSSGGSVFNSTQLQMSTWSQCFILFSDYLKSIFSQAQKFQTLLSALEEEVYAQQPPHIPQALLPWV